EARLAVGEVERASALRHRVVGVAFEEPRGSGVLLAVAGPEDPELPLDLLVRDPRVVGEAALRRGAELVEDLPRAGEGEPALAPERLRDVLDDPPVLPRVAGRIDRLVDLDHPTLDLGDRALVLLLQRA